MIRWESRQPDSNDDRLFPDGKDSRLGFLGPVGRSATVSRRFHFATVFWFDPVAYCCARVSEAVGMDVTCRVIPF
jgi:hypothetical protein